MFAMLAITTACIGAILGLRFTVLVLVPAMIVSSIAIFGIGIAYGDSPWSMVIAVLLAITALQIGYLAGSVIQFVVAKTRARKHSLGIIVVAQKR